MRLIQETSFGTGRLCALGFEGRNLGALTCDTGNYGYSAIDRTDEGFDDVHLLFLRQESALASMSKYDEARDALDAAKPGAESLYGVKVNTAIFSEWCYRSRCEAA